MKTKEELNVLKSELDSLNKKLAELSDEEMSFVTGGTDLSTAPELPATKLADSSYNNMFYGN